MKQATPITRLITEISGESVAAGAATLHNSADDMSHRYIRRKSAKINRQPQRLEIAVSHRKQTPAAPINRNLSRTFQNRFRRANSSHSFILSAVCERSLTIGTAFFTKRRLSRDTNRNSQVTNRGRQVELALVRKNNRFADRLRIL